MNTAYQQSLATAAESSRCLCVAFEKLGKPATLIDVGCGSGHLVRLAACLGVSAVGYDLEVPIVDAGYFGHMLLRCDLTKPWEWDRTPAEMVLCWEVGEHLPEDASDNLCDTLGLLTGRWLLFSAATPGQGGSGHINEKPHTYWREKLESRHLWFDERRTETLRWMFATVAPAAWWYGKNLMVFRKEG